MKNYLYTLMIAAALAVGCSESTEVADGGAEYGEVHLAVVAAAEVEAQTRAKVELPKTAMPDADRFTLHITGTYNDDMGIPQSYDERWLTVAEFNSPKMYRGEYKAAIAYGNPATEGPNAACFAGEKNFTILARKTVSATVSASLTNSAFKVVFGEWFNNYYTNARIVIRTESQNSFTFTAATSSVIFTKPATKLYMKGTAVKTQTGTVVEFPETEIGTTAACTLHTLAVNASQAGGVGLEVYLDDTFTVVEEQIVELNPEA